jgi:hypothetical protein
VERSRPDSTTFGSSRETCARSWPSASNCVRPMQQVVLVEPVGNLIAIRFQHRSCCATRRIGWAATTHSRRSSINWPSVGCGPVALKPMLIAAARYFFIFSRARPVARAMARWLSLTGNDAPLLRSPSDAAPDSPSRPPWSRSWRSCRRSLDWTNPLWRSAGLKLAGDQPPNWPIPRGDQHGRPDEDLPLVGQAILEFPLMAHGRGDLHLEGCHSTALKGR